MAVDSILLAHVSDSIERTSGGVQDYDATADFAANLLAEYPRVAEAAAEFSAGRMSVTGFDFIVAAAAAEYGK